eukprot:gene19975-23937_t
MSEMDNGISRHTADYVDGLGVFVIGGSRVMSRKACVFLTLPSHSTKSNSVELVTYENDHIVWRPLVVHGTPPSPRSDHASTKVGTNIYIFGGSDDKVQPLNDLHVFHTVYYGGYTIKEKNAFWKFDFGQQKAHLIDLPANSSLFLTPVCDFVTGICYFGGPTQIDSQLEIVTYDIVSGATTSRYVELNVTYTSYSIELFFYNNRLFAGLEANVIDPPAPSVIVEVDINGNTSKTLAAIPISCDFFNYMGDFIFDPVNDYITFIQAHNDRWTRRSLALVSWRFFRLSARIIAMDTLTTPIDTSAINDTSINVYAMGGVHQLSVWGDEADGIYSSDKIKEFSITKLEVMMTRAESPKKCNYIAKALKNNTATLHKILRWNAREHASNDLDVIIRDFIIPSLDTLTTLVINIKWKKGDADKLVKALLPSTCLHKIVMNLADIDILPQLSTIATLRKAYLWNHLDNSEEMDIDHIHYIMAYKGPIISLSFGFYDNGQHDDPEFEIHLHPRVGALRIHLPETSNNIISNILQSLCNDNTLGKLSLRDTTELEWDPIPELNHLLRLNSSIHTLNIKFSYTETDGDNRLVKIYRTLALYNRSIRFMRLVFDGQTKQELMALENALLANDIIEQVELRFGEDRLPDHTLTFSRLQSRFKCLQQENTVLLYRLYH